MRSDTLRALAFAALLLGCRATPYRCDATHACNAGSVCAADGFCAQPASPAECASGLRYAPSAERPGVCVSASDAATDAPADAAEVPDLPSVPDVADVPGVTDLAPIDAHDAAADTPAVDATPDAGVCARLPRLIAPLHGTRLGGNRVDLRLDPGDGDGEIQLSRDRDFSAATTVSVTGSGALNARVATPERGLWFWRARARCTSGAFGAWSARWAFYVTGADRIAASPLGWIPDLNGDGYGDLAIGDDTGASEPPSVDVLRGRAAGAPERAELNLPRPRGDLLGFGAQVAIVPDMNGDGLSELAVGACQRAPSAQCLPAVVIYGGARDGTPAPLDAFAPENPALSRFGTTLAGLGDFDQDGYGDLAIGDPGDYTRGRGRLYVVFGGASRLRMVGPLERVAVEGVEHPLTLFGWRVAGPGDVTGDGVPDLLVTSFQNAWVMPGASGVSELASPLLQINLYATDEGTFGFSASSAGDMNGDGLADFALGRAGQGLLAGDVSVYYGSALSAGRWSAPFTLAAGLRGRFGQVLAGDGDLNGDGFDDLLIGAPAASTGAGLAYMVLGARDGVGTPLVTIPRPAGAPGAFGRSLAFMGDFDGDRRDDFAVGSGAGSTAAAVFTWQATSTTEPFVSLWTTLTRGLSATYGTSLSGR